MRMEWGSIPLRSHRGVHAVAVVDVEDFDRVLLRGPWHLDHGYAAHVDWVDGKPVKTYMHRFVLGLQPGDPAVDHRDRDPLNNRKSNLRLATDAQNRQNVGSYRNSTSPYRGVSWCKQTGKWRATARYEGKQIHLGRFDTQEEAAKVAAAFRREHMPYSEEAA